MLDGSYKRPTPDDGLRGLIELDWKHAESDNDPTRSRKHEELILELVLEQAG
jgi:hypothetical protein